MAPQASALGEQVLQGRFVRRRSDFRDRTPTLEAGRYHLYVAPACPWSHRAIIVHRLAGLDDVIPVHRLDPYRDERGWAFTGGEFSDPLHDWSFLAEGYEATAPGFDGRVSVPVLWDAEEERIVNVDHFRCNLRRLADHPQLWGYTRELYQRPGIAATVAMDQIKRHYYTTHDSLEPSRIIPIGPELDFLAPHGRDEP